MSNHIKRWSNLRRATHLENMRNIGVRKGSTSGFKGVSWHGPSKKWRARITINGKRRISLGLFESKEKAGEAYRLAAYKYHGSFARVA
jgi:hypothetical protein